MRDLPTLCHTTVLGIGHRARQGKDLAARTLEAMAPGRVRRFAFSDAIALDARVNVGMTRRDPPLLQALGVQRRETDPDVWLRAVAWAIADWDEDADRPQVAVIAGVRFENEAALVRALGGHLWRIRRWTEAGGPYIPADRDPHHPTETALASFAWPHTLENHSGDPRAFTLAVQGLAVQLMPQVFQVGREEVA